MKKILAFVLLAAMLVLAMASCSAPDAGDGDKYALQLTAEQYNNIKNKSAGVMTYDEYMAAEMDATVVIEAYVQATQSWWDNKITVYLADLDGAYFAYEMACTEADAAKLVPGTKIKVTGVKGAWAGEVEIMQCSFEFASNANDKYIAPALLANSFITDSAKAIAYQNQLVAVNGATIKAIEYKNGEPGDDIYVTIEVNGVELSYCVERYLTAPDSAVYTTVGTLAVGDTVDVEGFLYWYDGVNTHITKIVKK